MNKQFFTVAAAAFAGTAIGIFLHAMQASDFAEPTMNQWGIFSLTSLGACIGCLLADESTARS